MVGILSIDNIPQFLSPGQTYSFTIRWSALESASYFATFRICEYNLGNLGYNSEFYVDTDGTIDIPVTIPLTAIGSVNIQAQLSMDYYSSTCNDNVYLSSNYYNIPIGKWKCTGVNSGVCEPGIGDAYVFNTEAECIASSSCAPLPTKWKCTDRNAASGSRCTQTADGTYDDQATCEASINCQPIVTPKWKCVGVNTGVCAQASDGTYNSQAECQAAVGCAPIVVQKWKCTGANTGVCVQASDGTYNSQTECQAAVGCAPIVVQKWKCTGINTGVCTQAADGIYDSQAECQVAVGCAYIERESPCNGLGDVDLDGVITGKDVSLVSQISVGSVTPTAEQKRRADVNGDDVIDSTDALLISKYLNGEIDTFPACSKVSDDKTDTTNEVTYSGGISATSALILAAAGIGALYLITKGKKKVG